MGFPVGYSELPKLLLYLLFLLAHLRRLINWAFHFLGLGSFLDVESQWQHDTGIHSHQQQLGLSSASAELIRESLPVIQFKELLTSEGGRHDLPERCAVCLYEFVREDEIRQMNNCCHVFHRQCVDRWVEHGQCTCPLCRAPLLPQELQGRACATEANTDGSPYDEYYHYSFSSPSASMLLPIPFPYS